MSPEQWEIVSQLFQAARAKTGGERMALLDSACSDASLRQVIEQMLRDDDAASSFLNDPILQSCAGRTADVSTLSASGVSPGVKFGRYEIVAPIGRGGMGEVWRGHDVELDRPVALKFLACAPALGGMERLTREARAASALNHPNIITVHEVLRHDEHSIIVMELVEGNALRSICGTSPSIDRVVQIGSQIARALATAHAHGIVHRDIKPENILVRDDGYIKVLDFGLARRVESTEAASSPVLSGGTLRYMSPEQARGESISPASDVFSFGLVLYELATGRHAFPSDTQLGAVCAMLTNEPAVPSSVNPLVPARLDSLILAMVAKHPADRPPAEEVARALDQLERQEKISPAWLPAMWKWAIAAGLIVAAITGWLLSRADDRPQFANLRIEPLTSQDGCESWPGFSPDGKSLAYTWAPRLEVPPQIYVKNDRDSTPVQITDARADGIIAAPAWSPDGKWIAFKRVFKSSSAIFVISSAGGEQKKLVDLKVRWLSNVIDWSPDGKYLSFSDLVSSSDRRLVIYLLDLRTEEKRQLTSPASVEFADWDPKFSPDGRTIAFRRGGGHWDDAVYIVPASGGEARRVTWQAGGLEGHAWSRDGKSLILSCQRGASIFGLWRFPVDGRPPERIIQGASDAIAPAISWKTGRLAWVNQTEDVNIYKVAVTGREPPLVLLASTARDRDAACSPDGRIAFVSDRSGTREIWLALADGSDQRRITNFGGPDVDNLAWSPDGRHLAFYARVQGHSDILTLDCDAVNRRCSGPTSTISGMKAQVPAWSRDGKFLYFASDRTGRFEIWREPASGGHPTQITHHGGFMARESPDGKWVYFSKDGDGTLWRKHLPLDLSGGSDEELVIGAPFYVQQTGWTFAGDEIVYAEGGFEGHTGSIRGYRISTRRTRVIVPFLPSFADNRNYSVTVSPDSNWIFYSRLDRSGSNIMVAENH